MAMLQCEICGGKLKGKPGGIYECEFCGIQYDTTWAKAKIQEIRGTVQVEGRVEVTGTVKLAGPVKVEGGVSIDNLLKRAWLDLEDKKWESAEAHCERALDIDPENAHAYLGKLMASWRVRKKEDLKNAEWSFENSGYYKKLQRYADAELLAELQSYLACIDARIEQENTAQEAKKQAQIEKCKQEETAQAEHNKMICERAQALAPYQKLIASEDNYTMGIKSDGTVLSTPYNIRSERDYGQCNVSEWKNISGISAGCFHTVGLRMDGTVVATEYVGRKFDYCQCEVSSWRDIVDVKAGRFHTVGLKKDGTVVAAGYNIENQCSVYDWKNINAIAAGHFHTVGLQMGGTVIATQYMRQDKYNFGQCEVAHWQDIIAVAAGEYTTVGLKSDGTVVAAGCNTHKQCDVQGWRDIVAISANAFHTVGLKVDGTVLATGDNAAGRCEVSHWKNIIAVFAGRNYTFGLQKDGTVVATCASTYKACQVERWKLFGSIETIQQEWHEARQKWEEDQKNATQWRHDSRCQYCGGELKGLFSKKCVSCGKPKDY